MRHLNLIPYYCYRRCSVYRVLFARGSDDCAKRIGGAPLVAGCKTACILLSGFAATMGLRYQESHCVTCGEAFSQIRTGGTGEVKRVYRIRQSPVCCASQRADGRSSLSAFRADHCWDVVGGTAFPGATLCSRTLTRNRCSIVRPFHGQPA